MKKVITLIASGAIAMAPATSFAQAPGQGQFNGGGWIHMNGPDTTGQPGIECEDFGDAARPGNAMDAPGSAFNPDGNAGQHYAGEQPQNSRNTASSSQYDTGCAHGIHPRPYH